MEGIILKFNCNIRFIPTYLHFLGTHYSYQHYTCKNCMVFKRKYTSYIKEKKTN